VRTLNATVPYEIPTDVALMSLVAAFDEVIEYMGWQSWAWKRWVHGALKKRREAGLRAAAQYTG
jgi:hypothetical protein